MKRCINCFEAINDKLEICPFCGHIEGMPADEAIHMAPGTILADRYVIGKVIGYGGFGVTYLAWDAKLEFKVAIKEYLPSEFSTRMAGQSRIALFRGEKEEQFRIGLNRFIDEARRLAKFQNEDGIVKVYDCVAENNTAYIIMEYLEGETLTDYIKRERRIPEEKAIALLMPVMNSLKVVHEQGILHRDIAPDNIFITSDGKTKLIDFGAARYATTDYSRSISVIVKPGYSPEEQYRSRGEQGPYTDVYSLAATLYKMLTGENPPDALERRTKVENTKKDIIREPRQLDKKISMNRNNAVMNALNIRIEDRTETVQKFIDELMSENPVGRRYGKIKKIDFYTWPLWLKIVIPTLLVIVLVCGALIATGVIRFKDMFSSEVQVADGYIVVPTLEGLEFEDAVETLESYNLSYYITNSVKSQYVEANRIITQYPETGSYIVENGEVTITISRGTGEIEGPANGVATVPYFLYTPLNQVISDCYSAGFMVSFVEEATGNVRPGCVFQVTLEDGTEVNYEDQLSLGTTLILHVSSSREYLPSLCFNTESQAVEILRELGISCTFEYIHVNDLLAVPNCVVGQSVEAGTPISEVSNIILYVQVAEGESVFVVPNLLGCDQWVVELKIEDQLVCEYETCPIQGIYYRSGLITQQSLEPGTVVPVGTTIVLTVTE